MTPGRKPNATRRILLAGALVAATLTVPAAADWLVMTDGTRVETDGPWSEQGKLVVFTDTGGKLVSLRLSDVDLDASRQATADAVEAASRPEAPPPPRESVFRLTDADVGHIDPEDDQQAESAGGTEGDGDDSETEPEPMAVQVIGWDRTETFDGVSVRATLENQGDDVAVGIQVSVTIYDNEGIALSTVSAQLVSTGLVGGQTTDLAAEFPGFHDFSAVNFDISHRSVATRATEDVPQGDESTGIEG